MPFESEIFKKSIVDFNKLITYGFNRVGKKYVYDTLFMENSFKAHIVIDQYGKLSGEVFDIENNELYFPLKVNFSCGSYVEKVKNEYEKILKDIKTHCFKENFFIYPQSNRITEYLNQKYNNLPVFLWKEAPGFGVFKNANNKWFGIIMNIDYSKIDAVKSGEIEIINVKLNSNEIEELLHKDGFYPAWHMNKKYWISIILNDTLEDNVILKYIEKSRTSTL